MSQTKDRITASQALDAADNLRGYLMGACELFAIAGSLRRGEEELGDLELVVKPREVLNLYARLDALEENKVIQRFRHQTRAGAWGQRQRQFTYEGVKVDLFIVTGNNFGWIYTLRTGPADFSAALVTKFGQNNSAFHVKGVLPEGISIIEGRLYAGNLFELKTNTEEDVFIHLRIPWIPPYLRTVRMLQLGVEKWRDFLDAADGNALCIGMDQPYPKDWLGAIAVDKKPYVPKWTKNYEGSPDLKVKSAAQLQLI